jgi:hypothetical protein
MKLYAPTDLDLAQLAERLSIVESLTATHAQVAKLEGARSDLDAIQTLLDARVLSPNDTYRLQSLGVAFGNVLIAAFDGLAWAIVEDEYGRDPTIRYGDTSVAINVLTMISKRVEDGEDVDVVGLFDSLIEQLPRIIARAS